MPSPEHPLHGKSILVVEDNRVLAAAMSSFLESVGCRVIGPALDSAAALELVESVQIDAAILDVHLQNETCREIARELRERQRPMLFTTGFDEGLVPSEFKDRPLLSKPVDGAQLEDALIDVFREG